MVATPGSIDAWVESELNAYFSLPTIGQTKRFRAYVQVWINGLNVTDRLDPYLMSVMIRNGGIWESQIELDDRDGRLPIPPLNATVAIWLGWTSESVYRAFSGHVDDVQHGFGRHLGGRRMFIHAFGADQASQAKTPFQDHVGDGAPPGKMEGTLIPFSQAFAQFAANAGMTVSVGSSFAGIMRDYWSMNNESIMQFGSRHADELGGWSRLEGNNIVFNGVNDFQLPKLVAQWGNNLISWRVHPYAARPLWDGSSQQFFDHVKGLWGQVQQQFDLPAPWGGSWVSSITKLPMPAPNSNVAGQANDGAMNKASFLSGFGRIIINGEPQAQWGSTVQMIGARPGVDGNYFVDCAVHTWSRQGFVTTLEVHPDVTSVSDNIGALGYPTISSLADAQALLTAQQTGQPQQVTNQDGSITTYFPDGSQQIKNALGTTTIPAN